MVDYNTTHILTRSWLNEGGKAGKTINELIERLENGGNVTRYALKLVIGLDGLKKFDLEWKSELESRKYKPSEIVKYSRRIRIGLIHYSLGDKQSLRGDWYKSRKSFNKAEAIFEEAVEYLRDAVSVDNNLRMWIDRDLNDITNCPAGIPRPIWSNSNYKNQSFFLKVTKKDIARELLKAKLEELVGRELFELVTCEFDQKDH